MTSNAFFNIGVQGPVVFSTHTQSPTGTLMDESQVNSERLHIHHRTTFGRRYYRLTLPEDQ